MKQLIISLSLMLALAAPAQQVTGTWEIFPNYAAPTSVVETPAYVYTLSGTSLCGYDKATGEVMAFNTSNRLNDSSVSGIWYDPQGKYLFIVYTDYNIDLLYDDGRIINVPDLRDAAISDSKQINQVAFSDGKAYVALNSGMLVIDATHGAVTESCLWGFKIDNIAVTDKKILVFSTEPAKGGKWYVANKNVSHHNFPAAFTISTRSVYPNAGVITLGPATVMIGNGAKAYTLTVDNDATDNAAAIIAASEISGVSGLVQKDANIQIAKEGAVASGSGKIFQIGADGKLLATHTIPQTAGNRVADWDFSDATLWIAGTDGYGQYDLNTASYSISPVRPNGTSGSNVGIFHQLPDGTIYLSTIGKTNNSICDMMWGKKALFDVYDNGRISALKHPSFDQYNNLYAFSVHPDNPDIIALGYYYKGGVANLKTGESIWFDETNSTLKNSPVNHIWIDSKGNLWAVQWTFQQEYLLHKAIAGAWEKGDRSGWSYMHLSGFKPEHTQKLLIDEARRNIVLTSISGLAVVKMPADDAPLSSSCRIAYCDMSFDADGLSFDGWKFPKLVMDKTGIIWGASDVGVFTIANSDDMFNAGWAPVRPKVARNDGTNLADYLLDHVNVLDIAVDENNQKWISTYGSGLYRVSADGSQILDQFTVENSFIPSNNVAASLPDKFSNKIFVGTDQGLSVFHATSSPAAADYSDVYAYPNPVTPDYTGWITITGLMNGSLVKIADAAGRVFFQGKSDGGSVLWNGCDASGRRVKSGVYFVFASQHQEGESSNAAVAKIVVVN